ncbi:MAG: response regulator transcription factor [Gammaproteobacteria bacterium]|nr:response regulator transcription factor [Gammaproteobacteria bacterium]MBT8133175.1 response regulator transcription factor [Gammaproteobacteria bacterium]NNJ50844.1 response regulator transcription factor [Gammaproteobacteria bacterium]
MRIGLLEDDLSQIELISLWANEAGDQLQSYTTGQSFREAMNSENFDLLVLDWHLPDTTGIEELDWLRGERASNTPVIFITSRDSEESVVEALDHGADDYMVKPVSKSITLARIKALQRRNKIGDISITSSDDNADETDQAPAVLDFDPYLVNTEEHSISVDGETIKLTNKEFELASYLFRHAGCLVSRDHLLEHIWGTRADLNTRTVDTHVSRIRSKLRINPAIGWQLSSIYQRGYRLSRVTKD